MVRMDKEGLFVAGADLVALEPRPGRCREISRARMGPRQSSYANEERNVGSAATDSVESTR
jgi:hypothetical protein